MPHSFDTDWFVRLAWEFLQQALFSPQSMREFLLSFIVGFILLAVCLAQGHSLGGASRNSMAAGLLAVIVSVALLLAAGALAQMYVAPFLSNKSYDPGLIIGSVVLVFLIFAVPLTRTIFRSGYLASLGAWIVAAIVAGVLVYGVHTFVKPGADDKPPACPFALGKETR
ncbi:MAG: hypothetical protein LBD30_09290 [Verrucomicrobiales bacterium]|jgi:hypothetical protein|nr:hypothetical protein [Verrucomicrobiales bacterium]